MTRRKRKSARFLPGMLRAMAGAAPRRRGTILVVILGALALLSVITVAYVAVGKGDRHTAAVVRRDSEVNEVVTHVADYIAGIIADDVLSIYKASDAFDAGYAREGWDMAFTPWQARSDDILLNAANGEFRFSPVGTFPADLDPGDLNDLNNEQPPFPGSDPWLADLLPTRLNYEVDPARTGYLEDFEDWGIISNIAPDGRFINLYNLRGNFDAQPGGGVNPLDGMPRMGQGLTLFGDNGVQFNTNLNAYPNTSSMLDFGEPAELDAPAHWDSRQRHMFRPARDAVNGSDTPLYLPYQYCDADGDGFFDSRWQMLEDSSDEDNIISILPQSGRYRWTVGVRIVDLSAMLNVNTATNISRGSSRPDEHYPIGLSPADVDLVRFLSGDDKYAEYGDAFTQDYVLPKKYENSPSLYPYVEELNRNDDSIAARRAYSYMYRTILDNAIPGANEPVANINLNPARRYDHFRTHGAYFNDVGLAVQPLLGTPALSVGGRFSIDDQIELMTRHGANDDERLSRMERAVGGRHLPWYSPLRDNWPTTLETGFHDIDGPGMEGNGEIDLNAKLKMAWDTRRLTTVVSGARRLQSGLIRSDDPTDPQAYADDVKRSMVRLDWGVRDSPFDAYGALLEATGATSGQPFPFFLFYAYARAIMPHMDEIAGVDNFEAWKDPQNSPYSTTCYGDSPIFAMLTAAHLTANLTDMFDKDQAGQHKTTRGPSAFTLVLANDFQDDTIGYRWEQLKIGDEYLPDKSDLPYFEQGAVNVYGIEAQPFITEVSSILIYTDEHYKGGGNQGIEFGDAEYEDPDDGPGFDIPFDEDFDVTINGQMSNGNGDFVVQLLAFQLTNPFGEDVHLTSLDTADGEVVGNSEFLYYIEYAGVSYKLAGVPATFNTPGDIGNASELKSIVLEPGETRNFVALSQPFGRIYERFEAGGDGSISQQQFRDWIEQNLGVDTDDENLDGSPIFIEPFSEISGIQNSLSNTGVHDFFAQGAVIEDQNEVRLWRRMTQSNESEGANLPYNDLLADRLRSPTMKTTLDRSLIPGDDGNKGFEIPSTDPLLDPTQDPGGNNGDNTGFTIVLWGTVKRPDGSELVETPRGAIPAWCIERRVGAGNSLNQTFTDGVVDITGGVFTTMPGDYGYKSFEDFLDETVSGGLNGGQLANSGIIKTLVKTPEDKSGIVDSDEIQSRGIDELAMSELQLPFSRLYAQINLNNEEWETDPDNNANTGDEFLRLRLGDLVMPLAIGPMYDPSGATHRGDGWLTLGEALCSALGYEQAGLNDGGNAVPSPADDLHISTDRGNLRLDTYVPFLDVNLNGQLDLNEYDFIRGSGIPVAQEIFGSFTTIDPAYSSLVKPVYGTININTAPLSILRLLPQLSPMYGTDAAIGQAGWWWDPANATVHDQRSDIAATMYAYTHKLAVWARDVTNLTQDNAINFDERYSDGAGGDVEDDDTFVDPTNARSREARTGILGVRETPGFSTIGEVLNVRDVLYNGGIGGGGGQYAAPHDIDRLGVADDGNIINPVNVEEPGVESFFYEGDDDGLRDDTDEILSEYDQKLAIANGLFNTINVRSDIYAVWFVIHGYQRSDVEGLRPEEPMVPSVARRYLMIVDRSNVTQLGEKPRILAFKQLPM